jgi:P-type Ca2+ transporter type 2C
MSQSETVARAAIQDDRLSGLTEAQAASRLQAHGRNLVPSQADRHHLLFRVIEILRQPMLLLLLAAALIYVILGDAIEAMALLAGVAFIIGITVLQRQRSENALYALRRLSAPVATVVRDGTSRRISAEEVVVEDIIVLEEGDRVPADAILLSGPGLQVNESHLTGESAPVARSPAPLLTTADDNEHVVHAAGLVVQGHGLARVIAIGTSTSVGKIATLVQKISTRPTGIERDTSSLLRKLAIGAIALCVLITLLYARSFGWMNGLLAGVTAAISIIPEEFPVVITLFIAFGAWRIAKRRVLTRQLAAVEQLGAATVLCVDKTGTLTLNRMEVAAVEPSSAVPEARSQLLGAAMYASRLDTNDSLDRALLRFLGTSAPEVLTTRQTAKLIQEYPSSARMPAFGACWQLPGEPGTSYFIKGAVEFLLDICDQPAAQRDNLLKQASWLAQQGLRVLGVARKRATESVPASDPFHDAFDFLGLIAWADPVRPGVPTAVESCHRAGIRVVMVTGDFLPTATAVARKAGLPHAHTMTGPEMDLLDEHALRTRIRITDIVARVRPDQKLRLIQAFQDNGEIVAMTGDGVNDAPALKAADIGVALGKHGTEVARESAHLVLLEDDFSTLVGAIRLGRRIFDNLRQALTYLTAIHVPIAGVSLIPALLGWPMILTPLQVAFLELIIDPTCSIAFEAEPEASDVMDRPPRDPKVSVLGRGRLSSAIFQGLLLLGGLVAIVIIWPHPRSEIHHIRGLILFAFVLGNLGLVWAERSWQRSLWQNLRTPNPALLAITIVSISFLAAIYTFPAAATVFQLVPGTPLEMFSAGAIGLTSVLWVEVMKPLRDNSARFSG